MKLDALQQGIYDKLTGDAGLVAAVTGIHVDVEQADLPEDDTRFPYISFGNDQGTYWDNKTHFGVSALCQIDVWSRQNNLKEAKGLGAAIHAILHHTPLTIAGAAHIMTVVESETYTKDQDGHTKRGLLLVRVLYDEI